MLIMRNKGIYHSFAAWKHLVGMILLMLFSISIFSSGSISFDIRTGFEGSQEQLCQGKSQALASSWQKTKDSTETAKLQLIVLFCVSGASETIEPRITSLFPEHEFRTLESFLVYNLTAASDL
jgi:hypothetical protein